MSIKFLLSSAILVMAANISSPALAHWGTFKITDDNGEEVVVKHGLFSNKTTIKDRYGDGFENKRTIFGLTKDTKVGVLGNDVHVHKGLFGFGKTNAQSMLGDTVTSSKNPLYRNTNINLKGVNSLVNSYFQPKQLPVPPSMNNGNPGIDPNRLPEPNTVPADLSTPMNTGNSGNPSDVVSSP